MGTVTARDKERIMLDVSVTTAQKDALMSILKVLEIEVREHILSEQEEDLALGLAMQEGIKEGIANSTEKREFESYLFGKQI